ncbi:unnamed protein product [Onchocerca ochengi]|uniref:Ion channel n=1 Tax=Onchocerca ochengi TaxID=42157 RepID=A0A182ECC9_ONCOC|nr:unnamed protein product [Onchocerca ochengi]
MRETVGKLKWDKYPLKEDDNNSACSEEEAVSDTLTKRIIKLIKILAPHIGLITLLLTYIAIGASMFMWLEADNELQNRRSKLQKVLKLYSMIINETISICMHDGNSTQSSVERRMRPLLSILSSTHEYDDRFTLNDQLWTDSEEELVTRWSFAASVLYALTVITSTGYDHVTPNTNPGRLFTVFFGLVGIPLMFITAADIGKFLSEIVIRSYTKLLELIEWIGSVTDAIRDYLKDDDDSIDSRKRRPISVKQQSDELADEDEEEERVQLPIASYFGLIIGYCAIGSMLFNSFEKGPIWSFMHGVFFSFNTITTIGLGNIHIRNQLYLALVITYVIIGLAVITASLDLCSSTLKRTFTKLHYFGRKIRGARRGFANVSEDIREAMRIIAALKKTRPSKERITLEDLKRFLEVQEHLLRQPYVPYNVHIFRWIEDAYAQYFDEGSMAGREKNSTVDPILFF